MKLNILSDLHLSRGALPIPRTDADAVVLAGDIARPAEAVAWAAGFDKPVLCVPGNHEFYGGSLDGTVAQLKRLCAGTGIRVVDNDQVILSGVRFLGTTLWTDFMLFGEGEERNAAMREAQRLMRDFGRIRLADATHEPFTPAASAALFAEQSRWLKARLAEPHDGPTVVITHHAPSRGSIHPRFADSLLKACFVSDARALVEASGARLWVHGHTHDSFDYRIGGTRVRCPTRAAMPRTA